MTNDGEASLSVSNEAASDNLDPSLQKKRALMLERLANRNQSRLENSITRKSESESSSSSTASFLSRFSDLRRSIETQLAQCRVDPPEPVQLRSKLDLTSASISDLEKLVAESSYFLPSYEVRSSLKSVAEMRQSVESLNSELMPKKKFTFSNKPAKKDTSIGTKIAGTGNSDTKLPEKEKTSVAMPVPEVPGLRNKKGEVLVRNFKGLEIGNFMIADLESCEVWLMGCVRALSIHRLKNCKIYTGPVMGSILIDEVDGCVFLMASHQIRIHNAKESQFYLRVRSRPIIEDSNTVRFAPYCLIYEGIEDDLRNANLDEETGNWANVDDFRWLRAVQSPNWSILPENERIETVMISNLEGGAQER